MRLMNEEDLDWLQSHQECKVAVPYELMVKGIVELYDLNLYKDEGDRHFHGNYVVVYSDNQISDCQMNISQMILFLK